MNRPEGISLPSRETLKAFGALVQRFRENPGTESRLHAEDRRMDGLSVEEFAVCG